MARQIDEFDWDIVRYVVSWAPYGGPDEEDILPRFGMDAQRLNARFVELITELSLRDGASLNHRQRRLLARARELVPPTSSKPRARDVGLSSDGGQWIMRHGFWCWKPQAQQRHPEANSKPKEGIHIE
ncbi:hypothetical protein [Mycobacterium sp. URHD0025]|uniref:hypothetical protein n=1 Tax=Mycobacterium sp. URHD0025 TaxID=1298864 RepID=UPI0003F68277|nr:hypothetical protein [Mycobacterium sp. URHD0025]